MVLAVGDDGSARVEITVESVEVETRFEKTGEHAAWDSKKEKVSPLAGFKRYEAIVGHKFQAIVGPRGQVREVKGGEWPKPAAGAKKGKERDEFAAAATHDPTPVRTWLALMFETGPDVKETVTRPMILADEEPMHFHAEATETVGKYLCAKTRIHSTEREHMVPEEKLTECGNDMGARALALARWTRKRGNSWFSRKAGCLVKAELEAQTEAKVGTSVLTSVFKWSVELKDRGVTELKPPVTSGGSGEPTPTK